MDQPVIYVRTHDSVWIGEDGPTHQPVEHLAALRAIPNLVVIRPADANETAAAWQIALDRSDGPTALILTRQGLPVPADESRAEVARGAYIIRDGDDAVVVATGSEVHTALAAADLLAAEGVSLRVVSMPCVGAFLEQGAAYRTEILGEGLPVASIEAGVTFGWSAITGATGLNIGIDRFGASAPAGVLAEQYGLTPDSVAGRIRQWLA